jgi:hypothetical protein
MGRSYGWQLINSHAGRLPLSPYFEELASGIPVYLSGTPPTDENRYWTLGFMHDPYGYWGTAGHWVIPNWDLYTYGMTVSSPIDEYWVSVDPASHPIYGVNRVQFLSTTSNTIGYGASGGDANVVWKRLNTSNAVIDTHEVGDPVNSRFFNNMRSFMANKDGRFLLEFDGYDLTTISQISLWIEWAHLTSDTFLIGVPWRSDATPSRVSIDTSGPAIGASVGRSISLTGTSIADVLADTSGQTAWQDTSNTISSDGVIWILWKGLTTGTLDRNAPVTVESNSTVGSYTQFLRVVE